MKMTGRTGRTAMLLGTGLLAALTLAACGGGQNSAGGSGSGGSGAGGNTVATQPATGGSGSGASGNGTSGSGSTGGAATNPATGGAGSGGSGGTPECKSANLALSLGAGDGAAGHSYQALRFTNKGAGSCFIVGFPGVSYVTGTNGQQVGQPAARDGAIGGRITLAPGQVASAIVTLTDVGVFDAGSCQPTQTKGLRVYPPDETVSLFVAQDGMGCAGNPTSPQLRVQTIKAGPGSA